MLDDTCESAGIFDSPRVDLAVARMERLAQETVARIVTDTKRDTRSDAELVALPMEQLCGDPCGLCESQGHCFHQILKQSLTELATRLEEVREQVAIMEGDFDVQTMRCMDTEAALTERTAEVDALERVVRARLRMDTHEADNEAAQMLEDSRMEQQSASDYAIAEADYEAALAALDTPKEA